MSNFNYLYKTAAGLYNLQMKRAHKVWENFSKITNRERDYWLGRALLFLHLPKKRRGRPYRLDMNAALHRPKDKDWPIFGLSLSPATA